MKIQPLDYKDVSHFILRRDMTFQTTEKPISIDFENDFYHHRLQPLIPEAIERFNKSLKSYLVFNLTFYFLISIELLYLFIHLTFLVQTFVLGIHLSLIFATVFSYFILRLYFQNRKIDTCYALRDEFIQRVTSDWQNDDRAVETHQTLAKIFCQFATRLHGQEYSFYRLPAFLESLSPSLEKMSCWLHWQDFHHMKEILLKAAVEQHIHLVKLDPTSLETHVGLANAYVILSGLYVDPRSVDGMDSDHWIPPAKYSETFANKFRGAAERAIEEFKILRDFAPDDPWVHAQLAYSYHDLQMPMEEINEYETILQLCPGDKETLYKLGKLYFAQGMNAKGLGIYETLKKCNYIKAESLLQLYGSK